MISFIDNPKSMDIYLPERVEISQVVKDVLIDVGDFSTRCGGGVMSHREL